MRIFWPSKHPGFFSLHFHNIKHKWDILQASKTEDFPINLSNNPTVQSPF
jgi:hypothetical protein